MAVTPFHPPSRKPHVARRRHDFIEPELLPIEVLHCGNTHFQPLRLMWPWLWPDDLHMRTWSLSSGDIPDVRKKLLTSRLSKVVVLLPDRHTPPKLYTTPLCRWQVSRPYISARVLRDLDFWSHDLENLNSSSLHRCLGLAVCEVGWRLLLNCVLQGGTDKQTNIQRRDRQTWNFS